MAWQRLNLFGYAGGVAVFLGTDYRGLAADRAHDSLRAENWGFSGILHDAARGHGLAFRLRNAHDGGVAEDWGNGHLLI